MHVRVETKWIVFNGGIYSYKNVEEWSWIVRLKTEEEGADIVDERRPG